MKCVLQASMCRGEDGRRMQRVDEENSDGKRLGRGARLIVGLMAKMIKMAKGPLLKVSERTVSSSDKVLCFL